MTRQRGCVLVLDDDASIRDVVAQCLARDGVRVLEAETGDAALHLLREGAAPDLILLDWRMRPMSGRAFAEAYRQLSGPHAPIVVVTAAGEGVECAVEIGASGFLRKPFDLHELSEMVARFVQGQAAAAQPTLPPRDTAPEGTTLVTDVVVPAQPVVSARRATANSTVDAAGERRMRRLRHLAKEVQRLRDSLAVIRDETRQLLDAQECRVLSPAEAIRLRILCQESERMRLELQTFWSEFEALRAARQRHQAVASAPLPCRAREGDSSRARL